MCILFIIIYFSSISLRRSSFLIVENESQKSTTRILDSHFKNEWMTGSLYKNNYLLRAYHSSIWNIYSIIGMIKIVQWVCTQLARLDFLCRIIQSLKIIHIPIYILS